MLLVDGWQRSPVNITCRISMKRRMQDCTWQWRAYYRMAHQDHLHFKMVTMDFKSAH